ncbi:uncharacterized protein LOC115305343 [Suricata suricatta]|uniref:uncharacterized protein LOC115305343 n=1 Tax=Suricata suricatta TaxID=37032 RepID=UPI0011553ABD|nr:uncharacterized protein LOC115305343 [Suricata suricatta]
MYMDVVSGSAGIDHVETVNYAPGCELATFTFYWRWAALRAPEALMPSNGRPQKCKSLSQKGFFAFLVNIPPPHSHHTVPHFSPDEAFLHLRVLAPSVGPSRLRRSPQGVPPAAALLPPPGRPSAPAPTSPQGVAAAASSREEAPRGRREAPGDAARLGPAAARGSSKGNRPHRPCRTGAPIRRRSPGAPLPALGSRGRREARSLWPLQPRVGRQGGSDRSRRKGQSGGSGFGTNSAGAERSSPTGARPPPPAGVTKEVDIYSPSQPISGWKADHNSSRGVRRMKMSKAGAPQGCMSGCQNRRQQLQNGFSPASVTGFFQHSWVLFSLII